MVSVSTNAAMMVENDVGFFIIYLNEVSVGSGWRDKIFVPARLDEIGDTLLRVAFCFIGIFCTFCAREERKKNAISCGAPAGGEWRTNQKITYLVERAFYASKNGERSPIRKFGLEKRMNREEFREQTTN